jgi:hypothetical protein
MVSELEDTAARNAAIDVSGNTIRLVVTGTAGTAVRWGWEITRLSLT